MVLKGTGKTTKEMPRASPTANISVIGSLKRFPDREYARDLLHEVAKLAAPLIYERGFKVGTLCEMLPKNANLLGLNVNRGQKILLRLRYHSNTKSFLPMGDIMGTFLHELTHNVYGPHDQKFYKLLDELKEQYETLQYGGKSKTGYICEEEKLGGGYRFGGGFVSERDQRIKALSKSKYVGGSQKLGGSGGISKGSKSGLSLRQLALEAAERRAKDSKWCTGGEVGDISKDDELSVINVDDGYQEVIDLTADEYDEPTPRKEVIVVDACEEKEDNSIKVVRKDPKSILRQSDSVSNNRGSRSVSFGLLPSLDDDEFDGSNQPEDKQEDEATVHYVSSSSPRTFIQDGEKYPRRKLVADLNFNQIMRYDVVELSDTSMEQESFESECQPIIEEDFKAPGPSSKLDTQKNPDHSNSPKNIPSSEDVSIVPEALKSTPPSQKPARTKRSYKQRKKEGAASRKPPKKKNSKPKKKSPPKEKEIIKKNKKTVKSIDFHDLF
ncbi:hypothetical protein CAAN3_19S02168 [[Candida] anglica]